MTYDKPFKSFDELLKILVDKHKLSPTMPESARDILTCTPYYDLVNGYKSLFMQNDQFHRGITFEYLYLFHVFDRGFQNVLFEASIIIENYFKNVLAYVLAKNFGVDTHSYLAQNNFISSHGKGTQRLSRDTLLKDLQKLYTTPIDNPTRYYAKHHNHIPPWILLKNTSFSDAIKLFSLLKRTEKEEILTTILPVAIDYQDGVQILQYILTMVRKCRNAIAHGLIFTAFDASRYGKNLSQKALRRLISSSLLTDEELFKGKLIYGVYGYIIFTITLIRIPLEKSIFAQRLTDYVNLSLFSDFSPSVTPTSLSSEYLSLLGIPSDFCTRISKYLQELQQETNLLP